VKTNLVKVFYFGERRKQIEEAKTDKFFFLKKQVEYLCNTKHDLDQITFVINGDIPEGYEEEVLPLKQKFKFVTLSRENVGISYGAYSHAVDIFIDDFDFFIFSEDDFIFCKDNFDTIFKEKFYSIDNASMIAAVSQNYDGYYRKHASVSIYGTSKEILKRIISDHGKLPFTDKDLVLTYSEGQVYHTNLFFEYGEVLDHTKDFRIIFHDGKGFHFFGDDKNPCIITSVEAIVDPKIKFIKNEKNMSNI
tara:strand:- start:1313 stop:2059 length:747 start_codon:yes stop_codon:yes gene_type:complete